MNESPESGITIEEFNPYVIGFILSKLKNRDFVNVPRVSREWNELSQSYSVLLARYQDNKLTEEKRQTLFNKMLNLGFNQKPSIVVFANTAYYTKLYFKTMEQHLPTISDQNSRITSFLAELHSLGNTKLDDIENKEYLFDMINELKGMFAMREELNLVQIAQYALKEIEAIKDHYPFAYEVALHLINFGHHNGKKVKRCQRFQELFEEFLSSQDTQQTPNEFIMHYQEEQMPARERGDLSFCLILGDLCQNNLVLNNPNELNLVKMLGLTPEVHKMILGVWFDSIMLNMKTNPYTPQNSHLIKAFEKNDPNLFIDTFCPNGLLSYIRVESFMISHKTQPANPNNTNPLADIDGLIESDGLQVIFPNIDKDDIIQRRAAIRRALINQQSTVRSIDEVSGTPKPKRQKRSRA